MAWGASFVEMISRIKAVQYPEKTTPQRAQWNTVVGLDFLQPLHFMYAWDFSQPDDDLLQVLQI
jgi:hypothetical protein